MAAREMTSSLRLTRIASESLLRQKLLSGEGSPGRQIELTVSQMKMMVQEMKAEWEHNNDSPDSAKPSISSAGTSNTSKSIVNQWRAVVRNEPEARGIVARLPNH
jgi:hypothetical protein